MTKQTKRADYCNLQLCLANYNEQQAQEIYFFMNLVNSSNPSSSDGHKFSLSNFLTVLNFHV